MWIKCTEGRVKYLELGGAGDRQIVVQAEEACIMIASGVFV